MIRLLRCCLCLACLICAAPQLQGQVHMRLKEDTLLAAAGGTMSLQTLVHNTGTDTAVYRLRLHGNSFQLLNAIPPRIILAPGDSMLIAANFYVPRKTPAGQDYRLSLHFIPDRNNSKVLLPDTAVVIIAPIRQVLLQPMETDVYVKAGQGQAELSLQCRNVGNTPQQLKLQVSDARMLLREKLLADLYIPAFTDTLLRFTLALPPAMGQLADDQLKITGIYSDGTTFSTLLLRLYNTSNRKDYNVFDPAGAATGAAHMIGLYSRFTGSDYHYMEAVAEGDFHFTPEQQLHYQADALYYTQNKSLFFINSYLHYTTPQWGLQAGNLYRSYELLLNGRGAALQFTPAKAQQLELGFVNSRYNLASGFKNDLFADPYNAFYFKGDNRLSATVNSSSQAIVLLDPQSRVNSALGGGGISWEPAGSKQSIAIQGYASRSSTQAYIDTGRTTWGGAGALQYNYTGSHWQMQSNNYISTGAYAGFQKGAVNLDEKITYILRGGPFYWLRYNQYAFTPQRISPVYSQFGGHYKLWIAEAAMGMNAGTQWQFLAKPYYYRENNFYDTAFGLPDTRIEAVRFNMDVHYHSPRMHIFSLNADAGVSKGSVAAYGQYFAFKLNAGYQYKSFSFNAIYQHGPYYAGEMNMYAYTGNRYRLLVLSPGYTGWLFRKRLQLQLTDFVIYDGSFGRWSNNLNVQAGLPLRGGITLEAGFNRVRYGFDQQLQSLDLGVRKTFAGKQNNAANNTLDLLFFVDYNGNYRMDGEEPPARGVLVRIQQEVFMTDNDGRIVYKHLPAGSVRIGVIQAGGFFASDRTIWVNGRTQLQIPLHRMNTIRGEVTLERNVTSYNTDENVANISITAKDATGKSFSARTNEQGVFTLYVPANTYAVYLDVGSLPQKYECPDPVRNVVLTARQPIELHFRVLVQERPVKVKKFYSLNKPARP